MQVETIRARVGALVERATIARDDESLRALQADFASLSTEVSDWASARLADAKADGRDTLHADDERKAMRLRALMGDAAMAVADAIATDAQTKTNRARLSGGHSRHVEGSEWKSVIPSAREYKMQSIGTDPQGGYLVEAQAGPFFDRLRNDTVVLAAGPRIEPCDSDALELPLLTGSTTAYRVGELGDITESSATFGKARISIRKYAAFTVGSSEWFADAAYGPRQLLEMDQRQQIAAKIDSEMLEGNSTGIVGLRRSGTATSLAAAGATPTLNNILDAIYRMQANNARPSAMFMHPRTWNTIRKLQDSQNRYQLQPDPTQTADLRLFNTPVFLSNQISITETSDNTANTDCSWIALVDMQYVVVARRATVSVLLDPYTYAKTDKIAVRSIARMGMGVVHSGAVEVLTGVRP